MCQRAPFDRVFIDVVLEPAGRHAGGFGGRPGVRGGRGSTTLEASNRHGGGSGARVRNEATPKCCRCMGAWLYMLDYSSLVVAARGGAGGRYGGHSGGRSGRGAHGSTWGRGVLGAGSHRGGRCGHGSTWGRGVLGAGSHRGGNEASTPRGANAWLSWSLGFFAYVALILLEIVM
ncbi:hypothetical protein Q3G72_025336 [Acer saccharum]|nr:hypothetical protein Q3G72_025336 [Acer saccharum]